MYETVEINSMNMLSVDEIRKKAAGWLGKEFNDETRKEVQGNA